ncbi:MAG: amidohydrolase family protein [Deltaproteobacteria bacterium]|nr:amidohydrolase family protein [Deltaproteobacteria bacterium]
MNEFDNAIATLVFNLKLLNKKSRKNVLISAGQRKNKRKMLEHISKLAEFGIKIYATGGTARFFNENNLKNIPIYKISEKKEPNIESFLKDNRFDLVINILTGDEDYDESSDSKLIRALSIKNGIPLITDVEVSILTINQLIQEHQKGTYKYKIADKTEPWNLKLEFFQSVNNLGGFANYHAHFDKAYLINKDNLKLSHVDMQKKWELYKYLKQNYTHEDLVERISRGLETMMSQGVTYCRTFVDADSTVKLKPIKAALEVKAKYQNQINFEIGVQPLEGVLDPKTRKYFEQACEMADLIGGLPSKDRPRPEKHLDYIMELSKELNKKLDVHIDQENNPFETETELLALKTIEHGLQGKVSGIHAISLSSHPKSDQDRIIKIVKDAGLNIIVCPSAAVGMKQLEMEAPLHNSIAPVLKLLDAEVPVFMGVDNIYDLFMPFVDGDMWFECRMLMEATRLYDYEKVAAIACDKRGFE